MAADIRPARRRTGSALESPIRVATGDGSAPTGDRRGGPGDGRADDPRTVATDAGQRADVEGLVSVVLPTRDRRGYLREAVASVVAQTYDPIQLIVVDGSADSNEDVLAAAGADSLAEVRYLRDEGGAGAAAARNRAIREANGEFVAFLDDDDLWDREKLGRQVRAFREADPAVGVVYTGQRYVDGRGEVRGLRTPTTEGDVTDQLAGGAPLCPFSSMMVRAATIGDAGLLDERFPVWEDREWYLRLSRHCLVVAVPEPLVTRRVGDHGQLTDQYEQLRDVAFPLFVAKHARSGDAGSGFEGRLDASLSMAVATRAFAADRRGDALRYLVRSLRARPLAVRRYAYLPLFLGGRPARRLARRVRDRVRRMEGGADVG